MKNENFFFVLLLLLVFMNKNHKITQYNNLQLFHKREIGGKKKKNVYIFMFGVASVSNICN